MGGRISKNKKRNNRNTNNSNQNILNYNSYNHHNNNSSSNNNNNNNNNNINQNNHYSYFASLNSLHSFNNQLDLTNIDSLIDNNLIDNLINSDFSSYTDEYVDYYDTILDIDITSISSNIAARTGNGNGFFNNISTNNSLTLNNQHYISCDHQGWHCCTSNKSSNKEGWHCSSIFVTYNIKSATGECPKELVQDVQKRISSFKKAMKVDQLDLNLKEFHFNSNIDFISTILSKEIQYTILSNLSIYDILSLSQVNKYWYELSLNNSFWKGLLYRDMDKWNNKETIKLTIKNYESQTLVDVSWKKYYANIYRLRLCKNCGIVYRECSNYINRCCFHSDIRDIVHSRGVPSGVYWICCLSKPKQAPGCTTSCHEEDHQYDYLPTNILMK